MTRHGTDTSSMHDTLRVPIPAAGQDLQRFFEARLADAGFLPALDLDVSEHDELAQVTAVLVTAVLAGATGVALHYAVRWEAFHACSGQSATGESQRVARGRADGGDWVFAPHLPLPVRDGLDEL